MLHFLNSSAVMNTILDFLGVAGIIIFGSFIIVLVVDLLLASIDGHQGIFFNRNKQVEEKKTDEVKYLGYQEPVETTNDSGIVYNDKESVADPYVAPEDGMVSAVDFNKAVEEQQKLEQQHLDDEETPIVSEPEEENDEDIAKIAEDVAKQAVEELNQEEENKNKKVFKFVEEPVAEPVEESVVEEPAVEEPVVETPVEEVVETTNEQVETNEPLIVEEVKEENEELKRLEAERQELERKVAELEELRTKDREELLKAVQELKEKEPVVVEVDKKDEEDEKRKLANIARMNQRLSSIKRNANKIANKTKEDKEKKLKKKTVVTVETKHLGDTEPVVTEEVKEVVIEKPKFKKQYYENRLEVLEKELKEVQAELKLNKKDFLPLQKVKKTYARDEVKLRRQEALVVNQKVNAFGVNKKVKLSDDKKAKYDENVKKLKELKDSVDSCLQIIEANKDRYPILEKNNILLNKQVQRLTEDITSVQEALDWYDHHGEE